MPSLPYAIFARPSKPVGSSRLHTSRRRRSTRGWASRASAGCRDHGHAPQAGLSGVESLESRTLLDANDVVVSLVGNQVVLTLDKAGATVTNLSTVYAPQVGLLTINAASAGKLSTSGTVSGITIDPGADTIMVDLRVLPTFAGISVVGDAGIDIVTIGPGGVNLAAVTKGAETQSFSIDTGQGAADTITIANSVASKGAGAVTLTTGGNGASSGIILSAGVASPGGGQTYAGAVTLQSDTSLSAGGAIAFLSTVDGARRLQLAAGRSITFLGAVGGATPLRGITLAAATSVSLNGVLRLDGTGTVVGTSGFVIGANVNNVVFSPATTSNARTITNFSGNGVQFLGGSTGSRITNVTSAGNGVGLWVGPGVHAGTVITGNAFSRNVGNGVTLNAARGITLGSAATGAGNTIVFNGGYGLHAGGMSVGSVVEGNQIANNVRGQVANVAVRTWFVQIWSAPGLALRLSPSARAAMAGQQMGLYSFAMTIGVNGVSIASSGAVSAQTGRADIRATIQGQSTTFRRTGGVTYANAAQLGVTTGTPWVSVRGGSQPAAAVNSLVASLTPTNVLQSLQFPMSSRQIGVDEFGWHSHVTMSEATFATLVPLSDLTDQARNPAVGNGGVPVDVWINQQGYPTRFTAAWGGETITATFSNFGKAISVVVPPAAQTVGIESVVGRRLFSNGADAPSDAAPGTMSANGGNGGIIFGNGGNGGSGGRGGSAGWIGSGGRGGAGIVGVPGGTGGNGGLLFGTDGDDGASVSIVATVGSPDASTGQVTGAVAVTHADDLALTFAVSASTKGSVVLGGDGRFIYTPTSMARHVASLPSASAADMTDTFTITVGDRYGGSANVPVTVTIAPAGVTFSFSYGTGAQYWSTAARTALESAAANLASSIVVASPVTISYVVVGLNSPSSGLLATVQESLASTSAGYYGTVVQTKILTGVDVNGSAADGEIRWNFAYPWAYGDGVSGSQYDFQATALHELLHSFGFVTGIETPLNIGRNWSTYDSFLTTSNSTSVITTDYAWNSAYSDNLTGSNGGLYFAGPAAKNVYGGPVPLYTPSAWSSDTSVWHLDPSIDSASTHVMNPYQSYGRGVRTISPLELAILADLGYTLPSNTG